MRKATDTSSDGSTVERTLVSSHTSSQWSEEVEDEHKKSHLANENSANKANAPSPSKVEEQVFTIDKAVVMKEGTQLKTEYQPEDAVPLVVGSVPKIRKAFFPSFQPNAMLT